MFTLGLPRKLDQGTIPYAANDRKALELETGQTVAVTYVELCFDYAAGAVPPVGLKLGNAMRLIKELSIEVNNRDEVLSLDGMSLYEQARLDALENPYGYTSLSLVANATLTGGRILIPIFHYQANSPALGMTALDLRFAEKAELVIRWGDAGDVFNTPNDATFTNVKARIVTSGWQGSSGDVLQVRELRSNRYDVLSTTDQFKDIRVQRSAGIELRRVVLIPTVSGFGYGENRSNPAERVLTGDIEVAMGGRQLTRAGASFIQGETQLKYQAPVNQWVYPWEFSVAGEPALLDTAQMPADLTFHLDVQKQANETIIHTITEGVRPFRF